MPHSSATNKGLVNVVKPKIRVGLLVDSDEVPLWAYQIVERLANSDYAEIALIIENGTPGDNTKTLFKRVLKNADRLLYIAWSMFDQMLYRKRKRGSPMADDKRSLLELVPDVPVIQVHPVMYVHSDFLPDEDVRKIKDHKLDLMFRIGFRIMRGEILNAARYGIWSYHHGDNRQYRGGPAGFWETMTGAPEAGTVLQIITEDLDGGSVLYRSWSLTDILSHTRHKDNVYMNSNTHLPRKIAELHRLGEKEFFRRINKQNQHPQFYSRRLYVAPKNLEMFCLAVTHYARYAWSKIIKLFCFRQWILLVAHRSNGELSESLWRFKKIIPPIDRIWADPFVIYRDKTYYVFIEEMLTSRNIGHISVLTIDEQGQHSTPIKILEKPYHLSYPFLFQYEGELYMIPESAANRTIDLYRCTGFPHQWEHVKTLMNDVFAVDATLLEYDGLWWMFVTIRENADTGSLDELFLFYADNPLSDQWTPHVANPVCSDVKQSRPAGQIFTYNDNYYRPSQNGSHRYGYGIKVNQIKTLNTSVYHEECVSDIKPEWDRYINAVHTLNYDNGMTVSDASLLRWRTSRS